MAKQLGNQIVNSNGCAWGRETRVMVEAINGSIADLKASFSKHEDKVDDLVKTANGKPSWFVTGLITALAMLCCSLVTYLATHPCQQSLQSTRVSHVSQGVGN